MDAEYLRALRDVSRGVLYAFGGKARTEGQKWQTNGRWYLRQSGVTVRIPPPNGESGRPLVARHTRLPANNPAPQANNSVVSASAPPIPDTDAVATATRWMANSPGLSDDHRATYAANVARVLSTMPAPARKMAVDAVSRGGQTFYPDPAAVAVACAKLSGRREQNIAGFVRQKPGGAVEIHLDGGEDAPGTYAHEMWHAVDSDGFYSDKPAWHAVYRKDILKGKSLLSRYALTSPREGFAELGRVLQSRGADFVKATFPSCYAFLTKEGLV